MFWNILALLQLSVTRSYYVLEYINNISMHIISRQFIPYADGPLREWMLYNMMWHADEHMWHANGCASVGLCCNDSNI